MAREGRTLTRTMGFETRQHELFGLDLGDGPPRRAMGWGALCFVLWWGLLWLILGPPTSELSLFWVLPPALLAVYGWRDGRTARRRKVTEWALTVRWLIRGHDPVISLGRRAATRAERTGVLDRIGHRFGHDDPLAVVLPWRVAAEQGAARTIEAAPGSPVGGRSARAQLYSTEAAQSRRQASRRERNSRR